MADGLTGWLSTAANTGVGSVIVRIHRHGIGAIIWALLPPRLVWMLSELPMSVSRYPALLLLSVALLGGCSSSPARTDDKHAAQQEVRANADQVLARLYAAHPGTRAQLEGAAGHAVFRTFGMKLLVAGGGSGHGIAIDHASRRETFMRMVELQAGLGFGAGKLDLVWVFGTQAAFDDFVTKGFEIGGQATLAAKLDDSGGGISGAVQVSDNVWVYQLTETGLAAELTVKGTRYYRDGKLN
ncbi:MAG: hypothetical protein JHC82_01665 [Stenotrophomonas sp.]|nr:hypothetical protein [Stenotrophomonas sp.]